MNRRDGIKFSLLAAASLTACKHTDARERSRAHSTAMFLLVLQPSYLQQAYSPTPQNQLPGKSLLRKVMPEVFAIMRAYLQNQVTQIGEQKVIDKYKCIQKEMYDASRYGSFIASAPLAAPPYSTPDECPCVYDDSCPQAEALLNF